MTTFRERDVRWQKARGSLREGLALWRGPALGGIGESFLRAEAARLDELRVTATEERISADLATGQGTQLLAELTELVTLHPTRERLRGGFMIALYRGGPPGRRAGGLRTR